MASPVKVIDGTLSTGRPYWLYQYEDGRVRSRYEDKGEWAERRLTPEEREEILTYRDELQASEDE